MTSQPIQQPSTPTSTGPRERTAAGRFLIVGIILVGIAITNLIAGVEDWSSALSSGFLGNYALQLVGAVIGLALVVTGIIRYFRS
jgi:hypothetical protein